MAIYRNDRFGESKVYTIAENWAGTWHIKEYVNQCRKSEMTIAKEDVSSFIRKLEDNGWVKKIG
tara:strand:+ start:1865 stop:2056 length:192 start_codon:yes stop_codon:yes gene_type:complete